MFYYCYQLVLSDHYRAVRHISGIKTVNQAETKQSILNMYLLCGFRIDCLISAWLTVLFPEI